MEQCLCFGLFFRSQVLNTDIDCIENLQFHYLFLFFLDFFLSFFSIVFFQHSQVPGSRLLGPVSSSEFQSMYLRTERNLRFY